ncbi:D-alanine--D-alanine ligase family protein [Pengzhenrongella phosphoraccumulans]|uniref:D-alanine--D-alanine ligase family protein n=1 Tax=Pengzhenrongella phosphoraccumulans TaxID=3114394 RepID=UPI00388FCD7A
METTPQPETTDPTGAGSSQPPIAAWLADPSARPRVLLLFGGRSGEHAISCATAGGVLRAIDRAKYDVVAVGITPAGKWVLVEDDPDLWSIVDGRLPEVQDGPAHVLLPQSTDARGLQVIAPDSLPVAIGRVDVVFPLLHGPFGEDGTVQGMLELVDLRYVGAGVLASAVGMDKHFMKLVLAAQGIPVAPFVVLHPGDFERSPAVWTETIAALGLPVFVKPARAGSSLGISKVSSLDELPAAITEAQRHDPKVIVEVGVVGREIECAVLGAREGERARASQPGEIVVTSSEHGFYDFEAKYLDERSVVLTCPADLPADVIEVVRDLAVRTFEAVGCEGLARVDVFVTADQDVIVNEINTMPGFTPFSMYPRMWQESGIAYPDLIDELLQLALTRRIGLR